MHTILFSLRSGKADWVQQLPDILTVMMRLIPAAVERGTGIAEPEHVFFCKLLETLAVALLTSDLKKGTC